MSLSPRFRALQLSRRPRLTLRSHRLEDFPQTLSLWSDPEVTRYIGGQAYTPEECWSRLLRYRGHWSLLGFGYWLVEHTQTGAFVGEVGIADYRRILDPPLDLPEVGWVLAPSQNGKGYATEAVTAALNWAANHLPHPTLACIIHPDHHASIAVATRCGFERSHLTTYKGSPVLAFHRPNLQGPA